MAYMHVSCVLCEDGATAGAVLKLPTRSQKAVNDREADEHSTNSFWKRTNWIELAVGAATIVGAIAAIIAVL